MAYTSAALPLPKGAHELVRGLIRYDAQVDGIWIDTKPCKCKKLSKLLRLYEGSEAIVYMDAEGDMHCEVASKRTHEMVATYKSNFAIKKQKRFWQKRVTRWGKNSSRATKARVAYTRHFDWWDMPESVHPSAGYDVTQWRLTGFPWGNVELERRGCAPYPSFMNSERWRRLFGRA